MKFNFWTASGCSFIEAVLESDDHRIGEREEGSGVELKLQTALLFFDYEVKNIHPDLLGLLCMVNFYPFIGRKVTFPMAVSPRLRDAFQTPLFLKKKPIEFKNVDSTLPCYEGEKLGLAFGGGIDSSAVRVMFPEAFLIHEAHIRNGERLTSPTIDVVERIAAVGGGKVVWTNQRYVSIPGGWHTWPASAGTSLLLATDQSLGAILTGSNLGSSFLGNGRGYWNRHYARKWHGPSGNFWQSTFWAIGIPMFSPVSGLSEILNYKISMNHLDSTEISYCTLEDGRACGVCTKCFRRDLIRQFLRPEEAIDWSPYHNDAVLRLINERPLYFGHIFSTVKSINHLPTWIKQALDDMPTIDWTLRYDSEMFDFCPPDFHEMMEDRVKSFVEPMTTDDIQQLKSWNQMEEKEIEEETIVPELDSDSDADYKEDSIYDRIASLVSGVPEEKPIVKKRKDEPEEDDPEEDESPKTMLEIYRLRIGDFPQAKEMLSALRRLKKKRRSWNFYEYASNSGVNPRYSVLTGIIKSKERAEIHANRIEETTGWSVELVIEYH